METPEAILEAPEKALGRSSGPQTPRLPDPGWMALAGGRLIDPAIFQAWTRCREARNNKPASRKRFLP